MTAAPEVLAVARTQLGTVESPVGSNNVTYNTWYYGRAVSGSAYPWCAAFVSWVADRAKATAIIPKHAYTPSGAAWFQSRKQWSRTPKVGSIVYYHWTGMTRISHVGIVEAVNSDGSWVAIEGNTDVTGGRTGGKVMRQRRTSLGTLGGFGHPAYSGVVSTNPPTATLQASAVTAAESPTAAPAYPGLLKRGSKGEGVRTMQTRLKRHCDGAGYGTGSNFADGDYGPGTESAVRWYQTARHGAPFNLAVDGQVGPATWASLWK